MKSLEKLRSLLKSELYQWHYNPSYESLYEAELTAPKDSLDHGTLTSLGAVAVDTGRFTGRSPKDKYIVETDSTRDQAWWSKDGSDNTPMSQPVWERLKALSLEQLSQKNIYIVDGFCGANPKTRLKVRLVTEVAWMAHFFKNMFIRPSESELKDFEPDWTIFNACKTVCQDFKSLGMRSEVFVAFHMDERMTLIGGTWYGGEIKKGIFSVMNYFLPLQGIGSFHCAANQGKSGDTALFFGLSGTGKTTLSTDPHRALIGDDEHGWDDEGVFNLEGGCYAKLLNLSSQAEPDIYHAIRKNALLENVVVNKITGEIDFKDDSKTANTRVSYPIEHIDNIVKPVSRGGHPQKVIFLTCDAFGVLPPVSLLTPEQAAYHFLLGYTAKVAGTELGVKEPQATFSPCFGKPFLMLPPKVYADILKAKIAQHHSQVYLVNTGWMGGGYGVGKRISIHDTRKIIDAILSDQIDQLGGDGYEIEPYFHLKIPKAISGVDSQLLNPKTAWADPRSYDQAAKKLHAQFEGQGKLSVASRG